MSISVIICTRNRARSIVQCLSSIEAAALRAALTDVEIIVVDNASDDGTSSAIMNWAANSSISVHLENEPRVGITIAKNRGLRAARGDLFVLTDDDCRLRDDYFIELLRLEARRDTRVLRGGRVELGNPEDLPLTIKTDAAHRSWHISRNSARGENLGNCLLGCNLSMSRSVYEQIGPFDESFGVGNIPAGEDIDYVFRSYIGAVEIIYSPEIVVSHHHGRRTVSDARRLWQNYTIGAGALYAKYLTRSPSLCIQLKWDLKNVAKEIFGGTNLLLAEYDFSYRDAFINNCIGVLRYRINRLKRWIRQT